MYLPGAGDYAGLVQEEVVRAMDHEHDLRILDPDRPLGPQFQSVDVVIDLGGSEGTRERNSRQKFGKNRIPQVLARTSR